MLAQFVGLAVLARQHGTESPRKPLPHRLVITPGQVAVRGIVQPEAATSAIRVEGAAALSSDARDHQDLPAGTYLIHAMPLDADGGRHALVAQRVDIVTRLH